MTSILSTSAREFESLFSKLLSHKDEHDDTISKAVDTILADVKARGDDAVLEYTNRFDQVEYSATDIAVGADEITSAYKECDKDIIDALELCADRIRSYHQKQMPTDLDYIDEQGVRLGNLWRPMDRVGIYVPGGLATYPSSVLMNAIPANVAGVNDVVMVVPAPKGQLSPVVLVAAKIAGIKTIFKIGGAQAVGALAYGTNTVPKVDKIVGPGNAYVAMAKQKVFGAVGIDMVAGPSEIVVVADASIKPEWVAVDLLSQAEHDSNARAFLITPDENLALEVKQQVEAQLNTLERQDIARKSWQENGAIITTKTLDEAIDIVNRLAPEHLELACEGAERYLPKIHHVGAIFLGAYTPEAIGDYSAGPSHVLPTSGSARYSSGLSVFDFLKRMSLISCSKEAFNTLANATEILAQKEALTAHAKSISIRMDRS